MGAEMKLDIALTIDHALVTAWIVHEALNKIGYQSNLLSPSCVSLPVAGSEMFAYLVHRYWQLQWPTFIPVPPRTIAISITKSR